MTTNAYDDFGKHQSCYYFLIIILLGAGIPVQGAEISSAYWMEDDGTEYFEDYRDKHVREYSIIVPDGEELGAAVVDGPSTPPPGYEAERRAIPELDFAPGGEFASGISTLIDVPKFKWVFGCGAVSGAMIAGYYDRTSYPNIYTGPTNGGMIPVTNDPSVWGSTWPSWSDGYNYYPSCSLIATKTGVDGRTIRGSINDYWIKYDSSDPDPYITNSWAPHAWGEAIGDYMKVSQSVYGNTDGSAWYYWGGASTSGKLDCSSMNTDTQQRDGTYGMKLFYQARGYSVSTCYNQLIDNQISGGFTYAQYKAEINAGRPVYIYLLGHFVVGVGYDDVVGTIYIHDTWDHDVHSMTWGSSYSGMQQRGVGVINLAPNPLSMGWLAGLTDTGSIFYTTNLNTFINVPGTLTQLVTADLDGNGSADLAGLTSAGQIYYTLNRSTWIQIPGTLTQLVTGNFDGVGGSDIAGLTSAGQIYFTLNRSTWTRIPGTLSSLVAGNFYASRFGDELAGLSSNGQIWVSSDMSTWFNIPGTLSQLVVGEFNGNPDDGKELAGINGAGQIYYTPYFYGWVHIPGTLMQLVVGNFNNSGNSDLAGITSAGGIFLSTNLSSWNKVPGNLDYLVAGNIDNTGTDDLAGLTFADTIYYTINLSVWVNIPGRLFSLAALRGN